MAAPTFDLVPTAAGWHVVLVAANGEPLMTSETYPDERTARKNITAVRRAVLRPALTNVKDKT